MEKISALIDKLQELKNSRADLQAISFYAQLLQAEVLHVRTLQRIQEQPVQKQTQSHSIAVIMPSQPVQTVTVTEATAATHYNGHTNTNHLPATTVVPEKRTAPEPVTVPLQPAEAVKPAAAAETRAFEPKPVPEKKPAPATLFDVEKPAAAKNGKDGNTLRKELNELAQHGPSLNDKLKQSKVEIGDRLGEMPVKDLKQAIGINDKFRFIQELFRGDVDMYERSIKTINEFHTVQEAEYWIERELKIRQGWLDDTRSVQHFYSLVKKRFS